MIDLRLFLDCVSPGLAWEMRQRMEQKDYWADVPQVSLADAIRSAKAEMENPPRVPVICIWEHDAKAEGMPWPLPSLEEQAEKKWWPYYVAYALKIK